MAFEYLTNVPLKQAQEEYIQLLLQNGFAAKTEMVAVQPVSYTHLDVYKRQRMEHIFPHIVQLS